MALPIDFLIRPKRKLIFELSIKRSAKFFIIKDCIVLFKSGYFHFHVFFLTVMLTLFITVLLSYHLYKLPPKPLFSMSSNLFLPSHPLDLRDRMGKNHSAVEVYHDRTKGVYFTAVLGNGVGLSSLARQYHLSIGTLLNFNGLRTLEESRALKYLRIPVMDGLMIKLVGKKSIEGLAQYYGVEESLLRSTNYLSNETTSVTGGIFIPNQYMSEFRLRKMIGNTLIYPVLGNVIKPFGNNRDVITGLDIYEHGVLFQTRSDESVISIADGVVVDKGYHSKFGFYMLINHKTYFAFYGNLTHLPNYSIASRVKQECILGKVMNHGNRGFFYFSLIKEGIPVNPIPLLR